MKSKVLISVLGGVIGTAIMTIVMIVSAKIGMPKMSPPKMLAGVMGMPIAAGWVMHSIIGIIYALFYTYLFGPRVNIRNIYVKGAAFGIVAFIFAKIGLTTMGAIFPMPPSEGSMVLTMIGTLIGHVIFGLAVVRTIGIRGHR